MSLAKKYDVNNINVTELLVTHSTEKILTNSTQNLIQINNLLKTKLIIGNCLVSCEQLAKMV